MDTAHYKVTLSYNGSAFAGFQRQADARTVQGEFEDGLRQIGWKGQSILGAGRTDAGVHARGQVVSFYLDWEHSTEDLRNALNYYLPGEMAVRGVEEAPENFHPRFDAKERTYCYHIFCQPVRDPLREDYAWRVWPGLKLDRMRKSAQALVGSQDFKAFGSPVTKDGPTVREVFSAEWQQEGDTFCFTIKANAFLYHMVRRITFALVMIGQENALTNLIEESIQMGEIPLYGISTG